MRTLLAFVLFVLPSVCLGQATPGGVYRAPGSPETWSYEPQHKERFEVRVLVNVTETDIQGKSHDVQRVVGRYSITDSQWPGMRKNVEKFCRQRKLTVAKISGDSSVDIHLIPVPAKDVEPKPSDPNYLKGSSNPTKSSSK